MNSGEAKIWVGDKWDSLISMPYPGFEPGTIGAAAGPQKLGKNDHMSYAPIIKKSVKIMMGR